MKESIPIVQTCVSGLLVLHLSGCATSRTTEYAAAALPPPATGRTATQDGVELIVDPFVDRERTEKYFRINAVRDGIGILHVRVRNTSSDRTLLVQKSGFRLVPPGADPAREATREKIDRGTAGGEATALVGASVISLPLLFAGMSMISEATEIRRNLVEKELADQTLAPGQGMEGFVYFHPVAKKVDWSAGATIAASFPVTTTRETIQLAVPLSRR